jgi:hypothetical protein
VEGFGSRPSGFTHEAFDPDRDLAGCTSRRVWVQTLHRGRDDGSVAALDLPDFGFWTSLCAVGMAPAIGLRMMKLMEDLLALQDLQFRKGKTGREAEVEALRKAIPEPILGHYDRLQVRGKKGVAMLRNGVCAECHMRVPIGTLVTLAHGQDVQLCGNCGRYLFLPAGEAVPGTKPAEPSPPSRPRKSAKPTVPAA